MNILEILPETTVSFNDGDGVIALPEQPLVLGQTYSVLWDGQKYSCVAKEYTPSHLPNVTFIYLGNMYFVDLGDTGEPFAAIFDIVRGLNIVPVLDESDHTIAIYQEITPPTTTIGFIEYLVSPEYHMGKPFRGFIGWKLAQGGGEGADGEPALVSSDGYTLQDVNGLNLIPKESE